MDLIIPPQPNSSVSEEIKIKLAKYTILAGENNSGKTNLIKAIKNHDDLKEIKIIYVPAERNKTKDDETTKTSATSTSFSKLLDSILGPIFDPSMLAGLVDEFDSSSDKKEFIASVNTSLKSMGVKHKEFNVKISESDFKKEIFIKLIKAFVKDLYDTDINEVGLDNIGMGTQRLIITALIQYYGKIKEDKKTLLIIEEPEIYLHPKWKNSLHESLIALSENPNISVLITTHDPYFIKLGIGQNIYHVFRDDKKKDATGVKLCDQVGILGHTSHAEINHLIFDIPSRTYFLELFECLFDLLNFKSEDNVRDNRYGQFRKWLESNNAPEIYGLRGSAGHPRKEIEEGLINTGIKKLRELVFKVTTTKTVEPLELDKQ